MTIRAEQQIKEASRMMCKPFTPARFEKLVDEFLKKEQSILGHKGTEYADNEDRLQNFHQQAIVQNVEPAVIALTYLRRPRGAKTTFCRCTKLFVAAGRVFGGRK